MNISEASRKSNVNSKMIRHYEELGILPKVKRNPSGYRQYGNTEVHILSFIKRGRELGFSLKDIKQLVSLWQDKKRSSFQVKEIALKHVGELENKLMETRRMLETLKHISKSCHGDQRPDCPILDRLDSH